MYVASRRWQTKWRPIHKECSNPVQSGPDQVQSGVHSPTDRPNYADERGGRARKWARSFALSVEIFSSADESIGPARPGPTPRPEVRSENPRHDLETAGTAAPLCGCLAAASGRFEVSEHHGRGRAAATQQRAADLLLYFFWKARYSFLERFTAN